MRKHQSDPDPVDVADWSAAARQNGESDEHFRWFRLYLALSPGDRTLANVARIVDKHDTTVRKVSARRKWRIRATRWDWEQTQLQALSLREAVTVGMGHMSTASGLHAGNLVALSGDRAAALESPAKTSQAIKSLTGAYRDIGDYAAELESRPEPDMELRDLASADPQAAARQALAQFMVSGTGRTTDRISAARAVLAQPDSGEDLNVASALERHGQQLQEALAAVPEKHRSTILDALYTLAGDAEGGEQR